jgi:hypothetical protein
VVDKVALSRFSASYSAGPVFRSWSGDRLFWLRFFVVFLIFCGHLAR